MNIRSISNPLKVDVTEHIRETHASVKSDETQEREGDGRQAPGDDPNKRKLNESEIQECLNILSKVKGIQDNHLQVQLLDEDGIKKIVITNAEGEVIKRIAEADFYQILDKKDQNQSKGSLLSRSA